MRRTGLIRILSVTTQQALKAPKVQLNDETRFVQRHSSPEPKATSHSQKPRKNRSGSMAKTPVLWVSECMSLFCCLLLSYLVDYRTIMWLRDRFSICTCGLQPYIFCLQYLQQRFFWGFSKSRAILQIGYVCHISFAFFAVKYINVIILHSSSSIFRLWVSIIFNSWRIWYDLAFPLTS
jgi:hypothetical protein